MTTTITNLTTTYVQLNTVTDAFAILNESNSPIRLAVADTQPADDSDGFIRTPKGEGLLSSQVQGLVWARTDAGNGQASVTE